MSRAPRERRKRKPKVSEDADKSSTKGADAATAATDAEEELGEGEADLDEDDDAEEDGENVAEDAAEDDDDDDGKDAVAEPPGAAFDRPPALFRYLFYGVWMLALPAGLAVLSVNLLKPELYAVDAGVVRQFIGEQQVPSTILFFTLFAMLVWNFRHRLPFASSSGILGRTDLPVALRGRYEDAGHLLAEARAVMAERRTAIKKKLKLAERRSLKRALANLEAEMRAPAMNEKGFLDAYERAHKLVSGKLAPWRKSELREYGESIGVAIAVALILRFFVIEAFKIPSGSMIPTLIEGDHIFVTKLSYGPLLPRSDSRLYDRLPPERGDVMVFKFPENKKEDFIKRAIALPGDKLEVLDGRPIINGLLLPHCYVGPIKHSRTATGHVYLEHLGEMSYLTMFNHQHTTVTCKRDRDCGSGRRCRSETCGSLEGPYRVAPKEAWVLGDNRTNSRDSRAWKGGLGAGVPFENIKGRASFVWWSWDERAGFALDRVASNVMGTPRLPSKNDPALNEGLRRCFAARPPVAASTPPPAKP